MLELELVVELLLDVVLLEVVLAKTTENGKAEVQPGEKQEKTTWEVSLTVHQYSHGLGFQLIDPDASWEATFPLFL